MFWKDYSILKTTELLYKLKVVSKMWNNYSNAKWRGVFKGFAVNIINLSEQLICYIKRMIFLEKSKKLDGWVILIQAKNWYDCLTKCLVEELQ